MSDAVWTLRQKLWTALAAIAVIFDGFDVQILAFAIPSLMKDWNAARGEFGMVLAIGLAGMAAGGPLFGYWGDRWGRRPALIAAVILFGLATVATAIIDGIAALAVLRFFTGLGAGGALPNAGALAAEFAPLRHRATAVNLTIVCVPLGGMLGGIVAASVLPAHGWRTLYALGGFAPILFAAVLWRYLPESPQHAPAAGLVPLRELFSTDLARETLGLWVAFFANLAAVYLVFGWLPALLAAQGESPAAASAGLAAYNFGGVCGALLWTQALVRWGSRKALFAGTAIAAITAIALSANPGSQALLAANGFVTNAVQVSMYALAAHVYPARIRASGVASATAVGRLGALLSSFAGATIILAGASAYWLFCATAMAVTLTGLAIVRKHYLRL